MTYTYKQLREKVRSWIISVLPEDNEITRVIFANKNYTRPALPYISVNMTSISKVGQAYVPYDTAAGVRNVTYHEDFTVSIQSYGAETDVYLQTLKDSLQLEETRQYVRSLGLAIRNDNDIRNISIQIDSEIEERYLYEVFMGVAQDTQEDVGYIEDVEITENYSPPS
ncbi:MAG: LIC_12616 family protein [Candidatus Hodarchaeota archaeon]